MKHRLKTVLLEAKELADTAEHDNRDFTDSERTRINALMAEAKSLKAEIKAAESDTEAKRKRAQEGDDALRKQVAEMGAGLGMYPGDGFTQGKTSVRGAGLWGSKFREGLTRQNYGQKDLLSPTGAVSVPGLLGTIAAMGDKVATILQLIPSTPLTDSDAFSFLRETVRTHNAAPVAAGGVKPTSVYTVERVDDRARTIAHLTQPIPRSYLADLPILTSYIDGALREGYLLELESQVFNGDGAGENIEGIFHTSGVLVQPYDTDLLTTTRKAVTALDLTSIQPDGWAIHPADWEKIELSVDLDGRYILSDANSILPIDRARRRLWGLPVALSIGVPEGRAILADFAGSTQQWPREQVRIDWSENTIQTVDGVAVSDFTRNLIRFRGEGRHGFAVIRPRGVVEVELGITS